MRKIYEWITSHKKTVILVYLITFLVCFVMQNFVSVNYDIKDYLPDDAGSTVSIDKMNEEFDGGIPNARALVRNVTISEALDYKHELENIEGVKSVTWLDDVMDVTVPTETQDASVIKSYYRNSSALYTITINEKYILTAVTDIREVIGEEGALTGNAVSTADATLKTVNEINIITAVAVGFTFLVLIITTHAWIEPLIILIGIGIAIVINNGTNLLFGEISFVTNAAGSVLQLAVSLDYAVFLLHRFEEYRGNFDNPRDAMVEALCKSTSSIASSGMTTVIGFLALVLMQFRIGPDLGLALAKGVAISLISVFTLTPVLILIFCKQIDKTSHKELLPNFNKLGSYVNKITAISIAIFLVIVGPAYLASNANDYYYGSSKIFGTDTQVGKDTALIEKYFGETDTYVLMVPRGDLVTEEKLSNELKELPEVSEIISYVELAGKEVPTSYVEDSTLSQIMSEDYSRMVISADIPFEGTETFSLVEKIRNIANKYYPDNYYLAGEGVSTYDLMDTITADMVKVNLIAIAAVFIVLAITMKSLVLPTILVVSIESAIWINMAIPYFWGSTVFYLAYLIISSIQLGATVDYAILFTERYKDNRVFLDKKEAVKCTISETLISILTSGSVLAVVGFMMWKVSSNGILSQLGLYLGRGALLSLVIVIFVLPGFLKLFDKFFVKEVKVNEGI